MVRLDVSYNQYTPYSQLFYSDDRIILIHVPDSASDTCWITTTPCGTCLSSTSGGSCYRFTGQHIASDCFWIWIIINSTTVSFSYNNKGFNFVIWHSLFNVNSLHGFAFILTWVSLRGTFVSFNTLICHSWKILTVKRWDFFFLIFFFYNHRNSKDSLDPKTNMTKSYMQIHICKFSKFNVGLSGQEDSNSRVFHLKVTTEPKQLWDSELSLMSFQPKIN